MFDDVAHLRAQAMLCREVARNLSDQKAADQVRQQAADYTARAEALETSIEDARQQN